MKKLIVILCLLFSTQALAESWQQEPKLHWSNIPVICGATTDIQDYLIQYKFELSTVAVGREGARPEGKPVYMVSYYLNEAEKQSISVITSPTGHESCMLYKAFDLTTPGKAT